ncbi:MAG: ATP-binding protein [Campylobacter sp.]|nr:ATP-binding protein [Campylobacter sp.]
MQVDASKNQNFAMDYTTKSGKHLSFSMFDNQSVSYNKNEEGQSLSLKRQYGFSFTYEGSKLTEADLNEIKDAMKDVEPMIQDFLANSKVGNLNPKEIIENAMQMANILPSPKDENHQNAIMDKFTNTLENLLKQNQTTNKDQNFSMLEDSKNLLEEILKQIQKQLEENLKTQNKKDDGSFDFYA